MSLGTGKFIDYAATVTMTCNFTAFSVANCHLVLENLYISFHHLTPVSW